MPRLLKFNIDLYRKLHSVVHEMAPDAELLLLNTKGIVGFENSIDFAIQSGDHIINYSVGY